MARDWDDTEQVRQDILNMMTMHGPNKAALPFCESLMNEDGIQKWVVDIHVLVKREKEFDIVGEGKTLAEALRGAYLSLSREPLTGS